MKIAILIPCYNSAEYLPELFTGIRKQSVPFDEIICYDDGSSDNTIEIAKSLGAKVISGKNNRGPAYARNRMIEASTSDFFHFHDSDDLIDEKFVEIMRNHLEDESVQLISNAYVLDRKDRSKNLGNITYQNLAEANDQLAYFLNHVGFASMGLYSKKALNKIGGFWEDLKGNEDPDLHIRLAENNYRIKNVDHFLVTKLEHSTSFSHQNWTQCLADKLKCIDAYAKRMHPQYHPVFALQAARLSNYFYRENHKTLSLQARKLSFSLGLHVIPDSKFSEILTSFFGVRFYLWLYRRRVDLNLV
ncbi:glycosyltransferase family 2 protein [Pedobacter sp. BMA]|uniref:glycosyltransferase family 2 protein n=1 Tax=Pedobacter sp. BMA TaxID=1663685 RepID=UPI00064B4DE4|nr:glycosyltransferase family 2 protein [Pedobacter sp. BMA]KLT66632.1 hypothetical protein AB669_05520 [Pedobacter sp. BMA]